MVATASLSPGDIASPIRWVLRRQRNVTVLLAAAETVAQRFGRRNADHEAAPWLPQGIKQSLAAKLLATAWFARNVVVDRWFLHAEQRALVPN